MNHIKVNIIPNCQEEKLKCCSCGTQRSVKYEIEILSLNKKLIKLNVCNRCVIHWIAKTNKDGV